MSEIYLTIRLDENNQLESEFSGTAPDALKMIAFAIHLLSKSNKIPHLEILSTLRGVLDKGPFEIVVNEPADRVLN